MRVSVIGIGADGWSGLSPSTRERIERAEVVVGGPRHLATIPPAAGQQHLPWPSPLRPALRGGWLDRFTGQDVVALASGDPLRAGIATTLIDVLGAAHVEVVPAVSSTTLARARLGWPAETVTVLRDHRELPRHLIPGHRILVLSADEHTPAALATTLTEHGFGTSGLTVLSELGGTAESRWDATAETWPDVELPRLNLVAVEVAGAPGLGLAAGLPDDAFDHDGQITKRDIRASALARLAPEPGALLWDVGAGAGSVAVEWMRHHARCRAVAIEANAGRAARIAGNAERLGVPGLQVVTGRAPAALAGLPQPDAIFVGGGATTPGVLDACWEALAAGGRFVVHGVTAQTEAMLVDRYAREGGELTRLQVERAEPLGAFTGWTPSRAVTQWAVRR